MPSGLTWQVHPTVAWPALAFSYRARIEAGIVAIAQRWAPEIENWMKQNGPWIDRTGNARQALYAEVEHIVGQMVRIEFGGRMHYQIYLELLHGGRYAIINPALDRFASLVWRDVVAMLR